MLFVIIQVNISFSQIIPCHDHVYTTCNQTNQFSQLNMFPVTVHTETDCLKKKQKKQKQERSHELLECKFSVQLSFLLTEDLNVDSLFSFCVFFLLFFLCLHVTKVVEFSLHGHR